MILAVVGSRDFQDYQLLKSNLDCLINTMNITEIVSGGARGADKLAEQYATQNNLKLTIFPAEWDKHGKAAGYIRNKDIWDYADLGIAFWDGQSKGTKHSFELSKNLKKKCIIVNYNEKDLCEW